MTHNKKDERESTSQRPITIAVTGNAGSGKSVVCEYFSDMGATVVSADALAREVVEPGTESYGRIVEYFGDEILSDDKTLDRPKLRRLISHDDTAKSALESFTHPEIIKRMHLHATEAGRAGKDIVVLEVPLLFESGLESQFDYIVLVTSDQDIRLERLVKRDHVSVKAAEELISIQLPDEKKKIFSDFIIENNSDLKHILKSVKNILAAVLPDRKSKRNSHRLTRWGVNEQ
ncbi:MAG: dephospho-CoA kinase [Desulfobacterales bacterium]|nr:dephospho-CoA kinase [Desulfobacterales bacterium]